jgi:hypothetical protein
MTLRKLVNLSLFVCGIVALIHGHHAAGAVLALVTCQEEIIGNPYILAFNAGQTVESIMPNTAVAQHWDLLLQGTLTNSGYSTAPSLFVENIENLVSAVQVNASAAVPGGINEQFKNVDMAYLRFISNIYEQADVARVPIGTANQAYNFSSTPRLYFGDPLAVDAKTGKKVGARYWFDTRLCSASGVKLDITWRSVAAMVYGGVAGTSTLSNTQLQVLARDYYGIPNQTAQGATIARQYLREVQQQYPVLSTAVDNQFYNLRTGAILHRLVIKGLVSPSTTGVSFADPSDAPLGSNFTRAEGPHVKLKINNNAYTPLDSVYQQLQNGDIKLFKLSNAWRTGYLVFEPSAAHYVQSMLNLRSAVNMTLWGDTEVTANVQNNVQLTYVERVRPQ